jgi:hypothetical protein
MAASCTLTAETFNVQSIPTRSGKERTGYEPIMNGVDAVRYAKG